MAERILVVDDEKLIRWSLRERLSAEGYEVIEAADGAAARKLIDDEAPDLALFDLRLPDTDGMTLLRQARERAPELPIIIITAFSSVDSAIEAMKSGAADYLTKPFNMDELVLVVRRVLETSSLRRGHAARVNEQKAEFGIDNIVGQSPAMLELKSLVCKIARSEMATVMLLGETGTGKDLVARAIHYESPRSANPFMNITCTALPETLLESELFGHEKGAFTDAKARKKGLFEWADGGTVFLDEIGDMTPGLQAKLLRVLEDKTFRRIGGTADVTVDVRIVAATNRDLEKALEEGAFREDLYYRLSTMPVILPPLRGRPGDIPLLAAHFLERSSREFHRPAKRIAEDALEKLSVYDWPGNVREFRNAIERAVLLSGDEIIRAEDVIVGRTAIGSAAGKADEGIRLPEGGCIMADVEKTLLEQALERTGGNQTQAASLLGLTRDQIRYKIEKHGLKSG